MLLVMMFITTGEALGQAEWPVFDCVFYFLVTTQQSARNINADANYSRTVTKDRNSS